MFEFCCGSGVIQLTWSSQEISSGNGHVCNGLHSCGCASSVQGIVTLPVHSGTKGAATPSVALGKAVRLSQVLFELLALKLGVETLE